jgi:hypothetical protein
MQFVKTGLLRVYYLYHNHALCFETAKLVCKHIQSVPKRLYLFQKFFFGPLLFGGRHLENFVPAGTAGISIKSRRI